MTLRERLATGTPLIGDGAMGTYLQSRGHSIEPCPEALGLANPEALEEVAGAFLAAGAEILQTNTFGGSPLRLATHGLEDRTEEINRLAAEAVRRVAGDEAFVTGSCGPCGRALLPFGDLEADDLRESCRRQMAALAAAGVDAFSIETMMDVEEALVATTVAREIAPEVVPMATLTFTETPDGFFTHFGTPLADSITRLVEAGAEVIGANCGTGSETMIRIAAEIRVATDLPLLIRPNAGLPGIVDGRPCWPESPEEFAQGARRLADAGVTILGGCCGTTPDHIRAVRTAVVTPPSR